MGLQQARIGGQVGWVCVCARAGVCAHLCAVTIHNSGTEKVEQT